MSVDVKNIIDDMNNLSIEALQHAAEISCYITERTIGPDLPEWDQLASIASTENSTPTTKEKETDKSNKKTPLYEKRTFIPLESNFPDINVLQSHFATQKLALECKRTVRKQLADLQQKHNETITKSLVKQQRQLDEERQNMLAEKQRVHSHIMQQAEQLANEDLQKHAKQLEQLRKKTQQQLQAITFKGVAQYQIKFRNKYEVIAKMFMAQEKDAQQACGEHNQKLRELIQMFEQLITKIKSGSCGLSELKSAEKLYKSLCTLEENILKELTNFKQKLEKEEHDAAELKKANEAAALSEAQRAKEQEEKQKLQLEQEQNKQLAAEQPPPETVTNFTAPPTNNSAAPPSTTQLPPTPAVAQASSAPVAQPSTNNYVDPNRLAFYNQINQIYHQKVERVKPLQSDENWKKYRTNCQKAINIPLNAISSVSAQHLRDKFEKLYNFISGQPYKFSEGQITVNDHPLARDYCLLLMAKKFVSQAETAISSNPQAAFPTASVIVSLWKLVPEFGQMLLAYVFKESPFLVPYFIPQRSDQSAEDYFKTIGYRMDGNQLEKPDNYLKRQAGIVRLYAAIMITTGRQADGQAHPYGIAEAWRWLTHVVALTPLPDICATLIMEMLQIVGSELWRTYGRQFLKLLLYIQQHYFPRLGAIDEGGPKTRLELLLGKFLRDGQIPLPTGILPQGFW